jgi:hypothetical protein
MQELSIAGGEASSAQGSTIYRSRLEQEYTRAGARMEQKHFLSVTNTKSTSRKGAH